MQKERKMLASAPLANYHEKRQFRQGQKTATILSNTAGHVTVIPDTTFNDRRTEMRRGIDLPRKRGSREMHRTTMTFETNPVKPDFGSTARKSYSGTRHLPSPEKARGPRYPYLHMSQFDLGTSSRTDWTSTNSRNYFQKDINPASVIHWPTLENKLNMNQGSQMRQVLVQPDNQYTYWTQYSRIHNKLGAVLNPDVPRELRNPPIRKQYNILTGEIVGPAWSEENRRTSGNRVLYGSRRNDEFTPN
ncbi:uncharacterized protein LOC106178815 [Lingula anatina]|uniref:Uncharacterized protein LOC106178815 n=1 Tax=Lingula anatina TaxID=7574 RepID=A0A1S3K5C4_LINAN|nr:uncharacterized protein LOC106178815 [Lingula anatina]|eukprot:XP_013417619.1 uncharacterized protein LOC106178815 [Lingula anatina]